MKGALASRARRRAVSVLPTPVGPIMRMFLGVISARSGSATCERRQRLRSAIAPARLASACPTMYLSSSCTISRGVMVCAGSAAAGALAGVAGVISERLDDVVLVGVDAQLAGDRERFLDDVAGVERGAVEERHRRGLCVAAAGPGREEPALGLEHATGSGEHERGCAGGDRGP